MSSNEKEINILLLGETGVGKSTFINAFANYLNFETLEEAEKGKIICPIPTRFVVTDANYKKQYVCYGYDKNESYEREGESVTQQCRAYCFKYGQTLVRLIDTPGVGDTRGYEQDKINFDNLLSFIAEYEELHLICILLKPDMPRLTNSFKYCMKQLLCHLQKEASENMVFLFTNSRPTFYRPKNTLCLLEQVLGEIKSCPPHADIPIVKKTMYCLDNDSFQLLIALRNGITYDEDEKQDYANSWTKSVKECLRLLNYITSGKDGKPLPPHLIQNTLSINEIRRLILALNKPMAKIAENVDEKLKTINQEIKEIENFEGDIENYLDRIKSSKYKFEQEIWDNIPLVQIFTIQHKLMKAQMAQDKTRELMIQMDVITANKKLKQELIQQLLDVTYEYEQELKRIVRASAKFALFIKNNAIVAYNDSFRDILQEQIENVKQSNENQAKIDEDVKHLKKFLDDYQKEKDILDESMRKGSNLEANIISIENINALIEELYALKITGNEIRKLHEESKSKRKEDVKSEVVYSIELSQAKSFINSLEF